MKILLTLSLALPLLTSSCTTAQAPASAPTAAALPEDLCIIDCLPRGSRIATPTGLRTIEDLRAGDEVLTANGHATIERVHQASTLAVTEVALSRPIQSLRTTRGHGFLTTRGWVDAVDLEVGDEVLSPQGTLTVRGVTTEDLPAAVPVYRLELSDGVSLRLGAGHVIVEATR